ncbi:KRAB-A domain-containing protein 2-like [Liolophura sinensis]|uniref:KRAB-A domain-containing protein 2-like n=1 Tax=Liolophura sinensis TaxID=3198878 RepID=UPI0031589AAD
MAESYENQFTEALYKKYEVCEKVLIPKKTYFTMIEDLKGAARAVGTKNRHGYYLLSKFEILQCGDVEKLIKTRATQDEDPVYYASTEDTYDVECQKKRKRSSTKGVVVRPILTKEFGSRAQFDLIDMQSVAQNSFKWIMVYQDHLAKFVILRALTLKRAAEVAHQLLYIFLLIGAPSFLQSDYGSEFTAEVISELKLVWPRLIMVHGKPRHPQGQGSVEMEVNLLLK